jgi:hypothetical protein
MRLCQCAAPLRSTAQPDPLRCFACGAWTPHGALPTTQRISLLTSEVASLAAELDAAYAWSHSIGLTGTPLCDGSQTRGRHSDPTGNAIADPARSTIRAYAIIAARLVEQAVRALRSADEAIGEALLAAEPPGPVDHTPAPFHDPATLFPGRPDLADAHSAKDGRHARGEGIPT